MRAHGGGKKAPGFKAIPRPLLHLYGGTGCRTKTSRNFWNTKLLCLYVNKFVAINNLKFELQETESYSGASIVESIGPQNNYCRKLSDKYQFT